MNAFIRIAALCLVLLPIASLAQSAEVDPDARTVMPGDDAAQVSGLLGQPGQELFGVRFVGLNGRNIPPRASMWLAPGSYVLTVVIDAAHVRRPPIWSRSRQRNRVLEDARIAERIESGQRRNDILLANEIGVELEAGKTYEIRARYNRDNEESPYRLVVHRVRDN